MSQFQQYPPNPAPQHQAPKKHTARNAALAVVAALAVLATGYSLGSGTAAETPLSVPNSIATPAPTVTVEIESVPQVCLDALKDADSAMSIAGDGYGILGDALTAAGNFDVAGVEDANKRLTPNTKKLTAAAGKYRTSRDACKVAAK